MSRRRGRATAVTVSRRVTGTKGERSDRYNYREMFRKQDSPMKPFHLPLVAVFYPDFSLGNGQSAGESM